MPDVQHWIHGQSQPSQDGQTLDLISPVTGEARATMAAGQEGDVDIAVRSSSAASSEWSAMDPSERGRLLWTWADAIEDSRDRLAKEDSEDAGKPILDCAEDVTAAAKLLRFFAGLPDKIHGSTMSVQPGLNAWTLREPYGVIGAIVPWNYPVYNAVAKVGGIVAMGNTCVLKPAEQAPTSAVTVAMLGVDAGLPLGVLNVVIGDYVAGRALARHMDVAKISFTGSTASGREVMQAAAQSNLKSCTLELGGKSPLIVFPDADLDVAAEACAFSNFYNQGQTCTATTRILVDRAVVDEFQKLLVARAEAIRVGNPREEDTQLGPLVSAEQLSRVESYVNRGVEMGATVVTGGGRASSRGFFYTPTVLRCSDPKNPVAQEEIFGPVATVIPFDSEEAAVTLANGVNYGLAASVWTRDVMRMHRMAAAIKAGVIWGNCVFAEHPSMPVGGYGESGFGLEYGLAAGMEYTRQKSVWLDLTGDTLRWTGVDY
ncbi:aldehyde dehydrogenase family protein [Ornithinimicrobium sp. LYQ121]|uniref:aldehyde dehydrogenase family protein n=1 Tax=Ornithinimicrobium sp. LYQ121 TaxID=3378801 RepID=UPI003853F1B0